MSATAEQWPRLLLFLVPSCLLSNERPKRRSGRGGGSTTSNLEKLAAMAIDCGYRIHRDLGPGLLESVYETLLAAKLARSGVRVERQKSVGFEYEGIRVREGFRADLLIERCLVIEVKTTERLAAVHSSQLLTYLRLLELPLGLLMNFGGVTFREGLRRVLNDRGAAHKTA